MKDDVPFLRDSEIEQEAALLLAEYARDHQPVLEPPVPIEDIVELHLKLTFELKDLEQLCGHRDVHGAIWVNGRNGMAVSIPSTSINWAIGDGSCSRPRFSGAAAPSRARMARFVYHI